MNIEELTRSLKESGLPPDTEVLVEIEGYTHPIQLDISRKTELSLAVLAIKPI